MKKIFFSILAGALIILPVSVRLSIAKATVSDSETIKKLFSVYGFSASRQDISFWTAYRTNGLCSLEECLQRRFAKVHSSPMNDDFGYFEGLNALSNGNLLGSAIPRRPTEFTTSLGEQKTEGHTNTTLKVTSITTKDSNTLDPAILGSLIVISINPGASNAEVVACTGLTTGTKTFTGCTFGYRFDNPTLTSSSNIKAHSPGEPVIISDTDTYNAQNFASVEGDQTVRGAWVFDRYPSATSTLGNATGTLQFVTKGYVDNVTVAGAATSTESTTGIVRLGTQIQIASSTHDATVPRVLYSLYSTSTPYTTGLWIPISQNNGQLHSNWFTQGNASTSFYGITAPSNNLNSIGWYGNAFRDFYASGTIYGGGLVIGGSGTTTFSNFAFSGNVGRDTATLIPYTNGIQFRATSTSPLLATSNTTVTASGADNIANALDFVIPGNTLRPNSVLRIKAFGANSNSGGGATSTVKIILGTTIITTKTMNTNSSGNGDEQWDLEETIGNANSLSSQFALMKMTTASSTSPTYTGLLTSWTSASPTINFANDVRVRLELRTQASGNTLNSTYATAEVLNSP